MLQHGHVGLMCTAVARVGSAEHNAVQLCLDLAQRSCTAQGASAHTCWLTAWHMQRGCVDRFQAVSAPSVMFDARMQVGALMYVSGYPAMRA